MPAPIPEGPNFPTSELALRELIAKLFTSHEEECRRAACQLHDLILQNIAILEMNLEQLAVDIPTGEVRHRLQSLRHKASGIAESVRQISQHLYPTILDDLGLPVALKALTEEFAGQDGMPAHFETANLSAPIPRNIAIWLYRIAQEALWNVAHHAGDIHVKFSLEGTATGIRLQVRDFGRGFVQGGLDLVSMAERARLIGATLSVQSPPGKGTTITVDVPTPS